MRVEEDALAAELLRVVGHRLVDPVEILFGSDEALRDRATIACRRWARELTGDDETAAVMTAARLVSALYPSDRPFDPPDEWWSTLFGAAVARVAGHPGARAVRVSTAAAMLGITRQGVHDLLRRGKLTPDPSGGVTATSIKARLRQIEGYYEHSHSRRASEAR